MTSTITLANGRIRMSAAEYRAQSKAKKPRKYRNVPTMGVDEKMKASKVEANRDAQLALLQRAGKITDLKRQPRFKLMVEGELIAVYVADWSYTIPSKTLNWRVVEDKKGGKATQTPVFRIKWALAQVLYPEISEWVIS